jgi:hypothetical protein
MCKWIRYCGYHACPCNGKHVLTLPVLFVRDIRHSHQNDHAIVTRKVVTAGFYVTKVDDFRVD